MKLLADAPDTRIDLVPDALDGEIGATAFEGNGETHVVLFRQKMKNLDLPKEEAWPFTWGDGVLTLRAELGADDVYGFVIR